MCHPGHFASWHRTFHRTMTQLATPAAVLGDFANATFTYQGVTSRFTHEAGGYFIETLAPDGTRERDSVVLTVGSRRIQQYVTVVGDRHVRLPLAWDIGERRWIHLNGAFLHPDGADFNTHRAVWDQNCIFCHNVKAQPRYDGATNRFDAQVAELGIACEACHGPAAEHIRRNANPLRRYLLYLTGHDPTLRSPADMTRARQVQVCGHCHGQRLPEPRNRIAEFMIAGDPYTAGEDLASFTRPIAIGTELPGVDFALRFWKDGTPRLTAYEYQGLLMSQGHEKSRITCLSCHDMHGGDPRGMIHAEMRGNAGCLQCHESIARNVAAHTHHLANGSGSDCYACHMPPMTFGIATIHPSHRITSPDPSRAWLHEMPEACTLCHANRTAAWAAAELARRSGHGDAPQPSRAPEFAIAEDVRALFRGDVVQRAVAANALGLERSYTSDPAARLWAAPFLLLAMEDRYGAVRHLAHRSLLALCTRAAPRLAAANPARLPAFDYEGDEASRARSLAAWWAWWHALDKRAWPAPGDAVPLDASGMPERAVIAMLRAQQDPNPIAFGE
jgi:predicted CXXCH cytochrome family protein